MRRSIRLLLNGVLVNASFMAAYMLRYGRAPAASFAPYAESWIWLTAIYTASHAFCGVYKHRFRSSWQLLNSVGGGALSATAAGIVFMYVFRAWWGAFPTSVFIMAALISIPLVFKTNQWLLRRQRAIKKQVIVVGRGDIKGLVQTAVVVHRVTPEEFRKLKMDFSGVDQIIVTEDISNTGTAEYAALLTQRFGIDIVYTPVVYMKLINQRINGNGKHLCFKTFEGERRDAEEFFIRLIDLIAGMAGLVVLLPLMVLVALSIKLSSRGRVIYKQSRVGKDGSLFTIYKFRTMYDDAEKQNGFAPACAHDNRITPVGGILRRYRLDEIPQLLNIIKGEMSLVGPRPENIFRVNLHKALQGIRLAVKPGLTGLAQIRGLYDLHPSHKLKYDYLYIQRRSLRLNIYILVNTLPVLFKRYGW